MYTVYMICMEFKFSLTMNIPFSFLLQDTMDLYYKSDSASDPGTLYNVRNLLKHKAIKHKVMDNVNNVVDLLNLYTSGMVVLLALKILEIETVDDVPKTSPAWETDDIKSEFLHDISKKIVKKCRPVIDENSLYEVAQCGELYTGADEDFCICDEDTGN